MGPEASGRPELTECFNALRPSLGGRYAEAITTDSEDPQDAIRRFKREEYPRIAVSVGMLDTGFDCPGVVNIVFCRHTGSEILYKQIRGREWKGSTGNHPARATAQTPSV